MAWIELHQSLFTHRKTVAAALQLEIPEVHLVGYLAALWTWALDNAPDGIIRASHKVIERVIYWTGESGALVTALTEAGFLHATEDGWEIHDWFAYAGRLMDQRQQNAARMRVARASKREREVGEPKTCAPHVQRTCVARAPATVPDPTVPNLTEPDQGEEYIPALRTMYEAFRALRHPDSPLPIGNPAEWNKALPYLKQLLDIGATPETISQATSAALARWKHAGQVTIKAIAEHWTELLEPEPVPRVDVSTRPAPLSAAERRDAEWQERVQRDLAKQLAAFDDWAAFQDGKRPAMRRRSSAVGYAENRPPLAAGHGGLPAT